LFETGSQRPPFIKPDIPIENPIDVVSATAVDHYIRPVNFRVFKEFSQSGYSTWFIRVPAFLADIDVDMQRPFGFYVLGLAVVNFLPFLVDGPQDFEAGLRQENVFTIPRE
jgi:hypothetical protein